MTDFEKNWENVLKSFDFSRSLIKAPKSNWKLTSKELSDLSKKFSATNGITGIELHKLKESWQSDRPFVDSEGNFFVLYINDQSTRSWKNSRFSNKKFKFHVCWCQTLETMTQNGRRARYKAKYDNKLPRSKLSPHSATLRIGGVFPCPSYRSNRVN